MCDNKNRNKCITYIIDLKLCVAAPNSGVKFHMRHRIEYLQNCQDTSMPINLLRGSEDWHRIETCRGRNDYSECQNYIGSPAMIRLRNADNNNRFTWHLTGIISHASCNGTSWTGSYIEVRDFIGWIWNEIKP